MGGNIENPTYDIVVNNNTGHVETIKITYDPKIISSKIIFAKLLDILPRSANR